LIPIELGNEDEWRWVCDNETHPRLAALPSLLTRNEDIGTHRQHEIQDKEI